MRREEGEDEQHCTRCVTDLSSHELVVSQLNNHKTHETRDSEKVPVPDRKYIILFEYFVDHKFWILSPPPFLHKFERARRRSYTYVGGGLTFDPPPSRDGPGWGAKIVFRFHGLVSEFAFGVVILFIRMMDKRREKC